MINKTRNGLIAVLLFPCLSYANSQYGPLQLYAQSPLQTNSLTPQIRSGFSLPQGTMEFATSGTMASVWAVTDDYEADYYQNQLFLGMKWQMSPRWQLGMNYRWNVAFNNHLDEVTMGFHRMFGLDQAGRDDVERDRFYLDVPDHDVHYDNFEGETLSSALTAYLQYQLYLDQYQGLSLGGSLYYNDLDHGLLSNSRFEQALQLNYAYQYQRHLFNVLLGVSFHHSESVFRHLEYRDNTATFGLSYQYKLAARHHLIGEAHVYEGVSDGFSEMSKPSTEFVLGYRYLLPSSAIEFSMIENVFNMDNSTDIAFSLAYRHQFNPG